MRMNVALAMGAAILLSGCSPPSAEGVSYTRDKRTDLCFASMFASTNMFVMTNVPCTDKVLALVRP